MPAARTAPGVVAALQSNRGATPSPCQTRSTDVESWAAGQHLVAQQESQRQREQRRGAVRLQTVRVFGRRAGAQGQAVLLRRAGVGELPGRRDEPGDGPDRGDAAARPTARSATRRGSASTIRGSTSGISRCSRTWRCARGTACSSAPRFSTSRITRTGAAPRPIRPAPCSAASPARITHAGTSS